MMVAADLVEHRLSLLDQLGRSVGIEKTKHLVGQPEVVDYRRSTKVGGSLERYCDRASDGIVAIDTAKM